MTRHQPETLSNTETTRLLDKMAADISAGAKHLVKVGVGGSWSRGVHHVGFCQTCSAVALHSGTDTGARPIWVAARDTLHAIRHNNQLYEFVAPGTQPAYIYVP